MSKDEISEISENDLDNTFCRVCATAEGEYLFCRRTLNKMHGGIIKPHRAYELLRGAYGKRRGIPFDLYMEVHSIIKSKVKGYPQND
jgi:hypothetical protein